MREVDFSDRTVARRWREIKSHLREVKGASPGVSTVAKRSSIARRRSYLPVKSGLRFSTKAFTPSRKSEVVLLRAMRWVSCSI